MRVEVRAELQPSEDPDKVAEAVNNIFPSLELEITEDFIIGETTDLESLENFKNKLGLQAIRDSARSEMMKGKEGNSVHFLLNKQAATVDKISFSDGNTPLGTIKVSIEAEEIDDLIDYLAPGKRERKS